MKEVHILRHAEKEDDSLTQGGIDACIDLANKIGSFDIVIASNSKSAIMTAELLSGACVRQDERANVPIFPKEKIPSLVSEQKTNRLGIVGAIWSDTDLIKSAKQAGILLKELVDELLNDLEDDQRALVVSHDGTMVALEKITKNESFDVAYHTFRPLEGIIIDEQCNIRSFTPNVNPRLN